MWSEPLPHPSGVGNVLLLDCEGMGDGDPSLGANLYLWCLLQSSSFSFLVRAGRFKRESTKYYFLILFI